MAVKKDKIALIGGHLTPALAVLDELLKQDFHNIIWIGTKHSQTKDKHTSAEYQLVTQKNIKFISFRSGKIWRKWTLKTFTKAIYNLILIPIGFFRAFQILIIERPKIVVSFGGYLALPIVVLASLLRIKAITHEQTTVVGLANRIIARFSKKVMISWPGTEKYFDNNKVILTGNPIRKEVLKTVTNKYKFDNNLPVIYVTGGNQGANTINWRLAKVLPKLLESANIIHQTGKSSITQDYKKALEQRQQLTTDKRNRYIVKDSVFGDEIGEVFSKADLVVSRAGANTVSELLALGKLAILIPIPWSSGDEQTKNAKIMADLGLAYILKQYDEMPPSELLQAIELGIDTVKKGKTFNNQKLATAIASGKSLVKPDSAKLIVDTIRGQIRSKPTVNFN